MPVYTRREFLSATAATSLTAAVARPNILFMMSDDHASNAIGAYGSRVNKTPNIDRIAREGARFDRCFCTNSICTPSRGAILTGQYSHVNGVKTLNDPLDPARDNVAKRLRGAGYQTAVVGKWHLHKEPSGFDYSNILPGQGAYSDPVMFENGKEAKHKGYTTDVITDVSLEWLKRRDRDRPFFLMCHHKAPHRPWQYAPRHAKLYSDPIPEPPTLYDHYEGRSRAAANQQMTVGEHMTVTDVKQPIPADLKGDDLRRWGYQRYMQDYLRCVAAVDEGVGRLLDYLGSEALASNTVVIYTSDQGMFLGEHGWYDKRFMYEEALRMPFLVRYPGHIKPGTVNKDMVLNIDFAPTFLDLAGQTAPQEMQGRSFRPLLDGKRLTSPRRAMYYRYWMHLTHHGVPAHYGIRTERHKLIYYYGDDLGTSGSIRKPTTPEWEMFDLERDPQEMKNVANDPAYASTRKKLESELARLQHECGDAPWVSGN
jgi:arylsulfatase A-like enzyme